MMLARLEPSLREFASAYSSVAGAEASNAVAGALPGVLRHDGLEDVADDIPELVVLVLEKEDETGRLGVEGGRDVPDKLGDDLLNAVVGDGRGLVEGVDAAAVGDGLEERGGRGHCGNGVVLLG